MGDYFYSMGNIHPEVTTWASTANGIVSPSTPHHLGRPELEGEQPASDFAGLDNLSRGGSAVSPTKKHVKGRNGDQQASKMPISDRTVIGLKAPRTWTRQSGYRPPEPARKASGRFFDTYLEATHGVNGPEWTTPSDDAVPLTDLDMLPFVDTLLEAITNLQGIIDNPNGIIKNRLYDKDWKEGQTLGKHITNPYYPQHIYERLAWDIVVGNCAFTNLKRH